jgi:hypothetical protein
VKMTDSCTSQTDAVHHQFVRRKNSRHVPKELSWYLVAGGPVWTDKIYTICNTQHVLRNTRTCDEAVLVYERRGFIFGRRSLAFGAQGRRDDDIAETAAQRGYILSLDLCLKLWFLMSVLFIMLFFVCGGYP